MTQTTAHKWRFYRAGGLDQVRFETGADVANLDKLDPKLWVALACPVKGLEFDERTLSLIDSDKDGRVRVPEILGAVQFLKDHLRSLDTLMKGDVALSLDALDESKPAGKAALASAKRILANLGKDSASSVSFADIADPVKIFAGTKFNGDGIIPVESADDADTAAVIKDILATQGGLADRGGLQGVDKAKTDAFFAELKTLVAWADKGDADATTAPFAAATPAVFAAVKAVRAKVDDFFTRCRLAAFDARSLTAVNRAESEYLAIAAKDMTVSAAEVAGFPLAQVSAGASLPLTTGVNPAWESALEALRTIAITPALGAKTSLTDREWKELNAKLAAHEAWFTAKPATKVDALGVARAKAILASGAEAKIADLIARDLALAAESAGIDAVEKLVRLNRDFVRLLNNFVSFGDFYDPRQLPVFQVGRLFLDSRECDLCIRVEDAGKHAAMAGLSKCYLAYCDLTRKGGAEKLQVLAVFSQGDSDYLMVGRNGIFIDRKGQDWDATISKIIDAPISIRQAFFAPYKKFIRMIEEMIAKRAAAADADANAKLSTGAESVAHADKTHAAPAPAAPPKEEKKIDLGTIALIGSVVAGVSTMIGLVLEKFFGLGIYMPLGLLAVILGISGPSMLIAALKLRQRNMGPILDANGWAVNGRVKVNIPFGTSLTHAAKLPEGSEHTLEDPFAEKPSPWPKIIITLLVVAAVLFGLWKFDVLNKWLPENMQHKAPAVPQSTAPVAPATPTKPQ
jgi:hypothetical protein